MSEPESSGIFIVNSDRSPVADFTRTGASGVKVQDLIGERQGSKRFSLRLYSIEKGGHTNLDQHEYQHQVYVLKGHGILKGKENLPLRSGDAVFIPANTLHQFINQHDEPLIYLLFNIL